LEKVKLPHANLGEVVGYRKLVEECDVSCLPYFISNSIKVFWYNFTIEILKSYGNVGLIEKASRRNLIFIGKFLTWCQMLDYIYQLYYKIYEYHERMHTNYWEKNDNRLLALTQEGYLIFLWKNYNPNAGEFRDY